MHWTQVSLLSDVHRRTTLSETCSKAPVRFWIKMCNPDGTTFGIAVKYFSGFGEEYLHAVAANTRKDWLVRLPGNT